MRFTVIGTPKPLKRHRVARSGHMYDPSVQDKKAFTLQANIMKPDKPFEGTLKINLKFYFNRPKSHYRTGKFSKLLKENISGNYNDKKPDLDNLVKLVCDSMEGSWFKNDSQIASIRAEKFYCNQTEEPRTEVQISFL